LSGGGNEPLSGLLNQTNPIKSNENEESEDYLGF
jgi:hypothetical protein